MTSQVEHRRAIRFTGAVRLPRQAGRMAGREWLTRDEVKGVISDESKGWRAEVRDFQNKQEVLADKLLDGAQAAIYSATILHGDPSLGIEGAIPNIQSRLKALEARADAQDDKIEDHHKENRADAASMRLEVEDVKKSQHKMIRFLSLITRAFFLDDKGNPEWKRIWAMILAAGGALHLLFWPGQSFSSAKKLVLFLNHMMGN